MIFFQGGDDERGYSNACIKYLGGQFLIYSKPLVLVSIEY
jgi:hypothetical protein